ncbi:MAG: exodeoxyribonuclease VII large subunit [Synergistaceae bacterium]|jgi:exodeoxyribonuclease VII large subunit|nr:exodeoxyribonuclease VII large subunit [Synergistaceae bacterium]
MYNINPSASNHQSPPTKIQTVDELSGAIKDVITGSNRFRNIAVRGEIQGFKRHSSGHVYFTLQGGESKITAVLFRSHAVSVVTWPKDGDEVMTIGSVDVYTKGGTYQLYATRIMPIGLGAQKRAKDELRALLEREGLFDVRHKRPLPKYPSKVAIVTSPTGAAVQDIFEVSSKRAPHIDIVVIPATVQGVDAPAEVVRALALAGAMRGLDCVIVARGGGAKDDLSPFDDERVVRAIRNCPIPVVTGVGHQIDSSLADLAADAALPTPSAAAERVFPDTADIRRTLIQTKGLLHSRVLRSCDRFDTALERRSGKIALAVNRMILDRKNFLDTSLSHIGVLCMRKIERSEAIISSASATLDAVSPLAVLARGYSICRNSSGKTVRSIDDIKCGESLLIRFKDGTAEAKITDTHPCA